MSMQHYLPFLVCTLLLAGCDKDEPATRAADDLYARVPADTAYFFTNTSSADPQLQALIWQQMVVPINHALRTILTAPEFTDNLEGSAEGEDIMRLRDGLLTFLVDIESPQQMEQKTGLAVNGQGLVYALELFPVVSLPVADQSKVDALIAEIMSTLELTTDIVDVDGNAVNAIHSVDKDLPLAVYWASSDEQLTLTVLPDVLAAAILPQVFGAQYPAVPMTAATIAQLDAKYGFNGNGSGFIKPPAIFNVLTDSNSQTAQLLSTLASAGTDDDLQSMVTFLHDPVCTAEMNDLLGRLPQISAGYTRFDRAAYSMRIVSALDQRSNDLVQAILGDAPIGNDPGGLFNMAVNISVGNSIKAMRSLAETALADPFQCAGLQGLNDTAQQLVEASNSPLPPFIGNMTGFALQVADIGEVNLDDANFDVAAMLDRLDASFALYTDNAQMLLGMGQMFLPQLQGVELQPGGEPQVIDVPDTGLLNQPVYAALTEKAIGISYGESSTQGLSALLHGSNVLADAIMTAGVDVPRYNQLINNYMQQAIELQTAAAADDPQAQADLQMAGSLFMYDPEFYQHLGNNFTTVRITADGLVMDSRQDLKFD